MMALSQPPSPPLEATQVDPISALTSSISFGRYVTESLEWEKWSTFTHNRYKEEAERYSKPGSVAQMKAYFEAHYKKKAADRAASLNKQQNSESNLKSTLETETEDAIAVSSETDDAQICESIPNSEQKGQDTLMVKAEEPLFESPGRDAASEQEKTPINAAGRLGDSGSIENGKSTICSSKSRNSSGVPKPPVPPKSSVSLQKGKHNIANPDRKVTNPVPQKPSVSLQKEKPRIANRDRKVTDERTMSRLLHLSSHSANETKKKPTSPILERILNSRFVKTLAGKTSKVSRGKPVRDSVPSSHHAADRFEDKKVRYRSPLHQSISRRGKEEAKSESTLVSRSEFPGTSGPEARPRIGTCSISFKSEERAAKRKEFFERLEQKAKVKMAENEKLHRTKDKAKKDPKQKLESSKTSSNAIKKVQENNSQSPWRHSTHTTTPPCSASTSTRTPSKLHDDISLSPWRHSTHITRLPCSPSGSTRTPSKLKDTNSRSPWSHSTLACSYNAGTKTPTELQDNVSRSPWNKRTPSSKLMDNNSRSPWRHTPVPSPSSVDKRTPSRVQDNNSRPPWRLATKGNHCKEIIDKNNRSPFHPASSPSKKSTHENSSPNIQLSHES